MPSVGWVPRLSNQCRWANVEHQNVSIHMPDLLIHCVKIGGTGAQWTWTTHTELWATEVSPITPIIQRGVAASKIWCCHNHLLDSSVGTDEPLYCFRKRGIRGRHWSVFLKREDKSVRGKHWSKNPDVCGLVSFLLLPGYFHPVWVTWSPRTVTFSAVRWMKMIG